MGFERNVFVNCPFDEAYLPLLRPLLFTIIYLGLQPRIALERADSSDLRLNKIVELIRESRYSIHDLSRSEAKASGERFRLNMPFELGIEFGCRLFGAGLLGSKRALVLEETPYRYREAMSDLSGADVECHHGEPYKVIGLVRNWLKSQCLPRAPGPARIEAAFTLYMTEDYEALTMEGFSPADIAALPVGELIDRMQGWRKQGKKR